MRDVEVVLTAGHPRLAGIVRDMPKAAFRPRFLQATTMSSLSIAERSPNGRIRNPSVARR